MIRVLLADDQSLVRAGFRMILKAERDVEVVGEAADGEEAIRQVEALEPDVVLMDIRMPGLDGIQATREIVERRAATRVIVLTTFDLDQYVYASLRAGASGFLLKDTPPPDPRCRRGWRLALRALRHAAADRVLRRASAGGECRA